MNTMPGTRVAADAEILGTSIAEAVKEADNNIIQQFGVHPELPIKRT